MAEAAEYGMLIGAGSLLIVNGLDRITGRELDSENVLPQAGIFGNPNYDRVSLDLSWGAVGTFSGRRCACLRAILVFGYDSGPRDGRGAGVQAGSYVVEGGRGRPAAIRARLAVRGVG